jgi:photosystem II stability/assembly factor-like uncharacterized protein
MRRIALASLFCLLSVAAGASAQLPDLLELPAQSNATALNKLVLDITSAGDRLVAVGEYGNILYSDDQGISWRQAQVPVQVTLTAVHFPSAHKGWAVGHDGVILHSEDAGETWHKQLDGWQTGHILRAGAQVWLRRVEAQLEALQGSDDEALLLQLDAAEMALDEAEREIELGPNRPLLDVWFADEQHGYAIGAFNYFFVTTDGGRTWQDGSARVPNPEVLHLYSIHPIAEQTLLMAGEFGLLLRSRDGGASWEQLELDYPGSLFTVTGGYGDAWVAGLRGNVFYSADDGDSWRHVELDTEASLLGGCALSRQRAVFVGLGGSMVEVDLNAAVTSNVSQSGRASFATVKVSHSGVVMLAGEAGLRRVDADGVASSIQYLEPGDQ